MRKTATYIIVILAAILAMGVLAGCNSQSTSEQSQEQLITELKEAVENAPEYTSITITENNWTKTANSEEGGEGSEEYLESTFVYKFDSGDGTLKTSSKPAQPDPLAVEYYTTGEDAVYVMDGEAYSGTIDEFGMLQSDGVDEFLNVTFGNMDKIIDSIETISKEETDGITTYTLSIDLEKYLGSADAATNCVMTIGIDGDGRIVSETGSEASGDVSYGVNITFSDYDNTTVDPAPEATKTYDDFAAVYTAPEEGLAAQ